MKYLGFHAFSNKYTLSFAPLKSKIDRTTQYFPFLGEGYYFWENPNLAYIWGKKRFRGNYKILEVDLIFSDNELFDLTIFQYTQRLKDLKLKLESKYPDINWEELAILFDYLIRESKQDKDLFPFKAIRALDYKDTLKYQKYRFRDVEHIRNYTILDPHMIINVIEESVIQNKREHINEKF